MKKFLCISPHTVFGSFLVRCISSMDNARVVHLISLEAAKARLAQDQFTGIFVETDAAAEIDGISIAKSLLRIFPNLHIHIIASGAYSEEEKTAAMESGALDYIHARSPVTAAPEFLEALRAVVVGVAA